MCVCVCVCVSSSSLSSSSSSSSFGVVIIIDRHWRCHHFNGHWIGFLNRLYGPYLMDWNCLMIYTSFLLFASYLPPESFSLTHSCPLIVYSFSSPLFSPLFSILTYSFLISFLLFLLWIIWSNIFFIFYIVTVIVFQLVDTSSSCTFCCFFLFLLYLPFYHY